MKDQKANQGSRERSKSFSQSTDIAKDMKLVNLLKKKTGTQR